MSYDIIIIGGGPAGMTSAIYALRANKKVLLLEKETIGGRISSSPLVENYPGFMKISGSELADNLYEQVLNLGGQIELETVLEIKDGKLKQVVTDENTYKTKCIIIATGNKNRLLGLPNEEDYIGNGIHFCVACDGAFYRNKTVAVIGGGNSAIVNTLSLADICQKVYVIQNLSTLTCEQALQDDLKKKNNVEIYYNASVKKIKGNDTVTGIKIASDNKEIELQLEGIFVFIGQLPETDFIKDDISLNKNNYIISDNDCHTNIDGIFVAGDVRDKKIRQLTTAVSDGTIAALEAIAYLDK